MDVLLYVADLIGSVIGLWAIYHWAGLGLGWFNYDNIERKFVRRGD